MLERLERVKIPERTGWIKEIHITSADYTMEGSDRYHCVIKFSERLSDNHHCFKIHHHDYEFTSNYITAVFQRISELMEKKEDIANE